MRSTGEILCGDVVANMALVGCHDGNLLVYDTDILDCSFAFGADRVGGIAAVKVSPDCTKIITGGESGIPLLLSFN